MHNHYYSLSVDLVVKSDTSIVFYVTDITEIIIERAVFISHFLLIKSICTMRTLATSRSTKSGFESAVDSR